VMDGATLGNSLSVRGSYSGLCVRASQGEGG